MKRLKAALFDLDGTLLDTEGQYTGIWEILGRRFRPDMPDLALRIKGTTMKQILELFPTEEMHQEIVRTIDEFETQMDFPYVPGAYEFVCDLKAKGIKCAVITSSSKTKMDNVWRKRGDFLRLFDHILTAEDFKASKPDPDCYLRGAVLFDASLDECIVFEDALTGLQAGMSSGILTVGLTTGNPREVIEDKCHLVIDNFINTDIQQIWNRLNT